MVQLTLWFVPLLAATVLASQPTTPSPMHVFVNPALGSDAALGHTSDTAVRTLNAAKDRVRRLLKNQKAADVVVELSPGVHHVGDGPLVLGPMDGGDNRRWVTWRSADPAHPAVVGAPIKVTGWTAHPTNLKALSAPLPANATKGTALRQFWVNGLRAERPVVYGHGRQPGDNRWVALQQKKSKKYIDASAISPAPPAACAHFTLLPRTDTPINRNLTTPLSLLHVLRRNGHCLNLTNVTRTPLYPNGAAFDFSHENATDPASWENPGDVEFVYTSCDAINCWIEPRCTVGSVSGSEVTLKQDGNESCYHRLYYYAQCFTNGRGPGRTGYRGMNPTSIENVASNWSYPGQFYYDRAGGSIGYIPRPGETAAMLEATATTATTQELLVINHTQNVRWVGVRFEYATWLGASGNKGVVDTQSGYLCQDGEPPVNVRVAKSQGVTFAGCTFNHLGAMYAVGADQGSQDVIVSNSTFLDISGGGIKLGSSGERGAPSPPVALDPALQDRGYLVSDNLFSGIPTEFSGANPIFAGYVADTTVAHNTIHDSRYSGICAGWGWGMSSYTRNIHIMNNSFTKVMQRLADGGGVYTNTPCLDCHVSGNYFASDPAVYGCLYHDGGSGLWNDHDNVFKCVTNHRSLCYSMTTTCIVRLHPSPVVDHALYPRPPPAARRLARAGSHITSHIAFAHGGSSHTTITGMWYNDSEAPNLQGDTNNDVRDANGKCVNVSITKIDPTKPWPPPAQAIIDNAGRRTTLPDPVAPDLSPPSAKWPPPGYKECNTPKPGPPGPPQGAFAMRTCVPGAASQQWVLSPGAKAGDAKVSALLATLLRRPHMSTRLLTIHLFGIAATACSDAIMGCRVEPAQCVAMSTS